MKRTVSTIGFLFIFSAWFVFAHGDETRAISEDSIRTGRITDDTPFVEYPIQVKDDNTAIIIDVRATSGDLDTLIYLLDENGNILAENDDRAVGDLDSYIEFPSTPTGDYTVIVTRFGITSGVTSGEYELSINFTPTTTPLFNYDVSPDALQQRGFPQLEPVETAEWTIFAYFGGDADIEAAILNDFKQFEVGGGSNTQIRIIALLDRSPDFSTASDDWSGARLFEVTANISDQIRPPLLDSRPLADLGVVDSGDGELLAQFLVWGVRTYPAKRYAVTLASHGAGWQGIITDYTHDTIITLPELQSAFDIARHNAGVEQFDLLINDACLMSTVEYHAATSVAFRVSIASPEIVVEPALNMGFLTETLRDNPNIDTIQLGKGLVDLYIERDLAERPGSDSAFMTHAVTDLQRFDPVVTTVEAFAAIINRDPALYSGLIGLARTNVYTYSFFMGDSSLIDLGHFMQQIIAVSTDSELVSAARDVIQAVEAARLYGASGQWVGNWTSYYSIYFPASSSRFDNAYFQQSPLNEWGQMLRNYYNTITPRLWVITDSVLTYHPPTAPDVKVTQVYPDVSSSTFPPTIRMEVTGRSLSSGRFTVDRINSDGQTIRLLESDILTEVINNDRIDLLNSWKSGVDQSLFSWLPLTLPVITDGTTSNNELLIRTGDVASLQGRYREPDGARWVDATVLFDENGNVSNVVSRANISGAVAAITIPIGSEFQAYRQIVTANGQIKSEPGTIYRWSANGLTLQEQPTPTGDYQLGFLVETFGGTTGFDSVTVHVDNENLNPDYRGYSDLELGVNFQHPADWVTAANFGDRLATVSPDGSTRLNVYYFRSVNNLNAIIRQFATDYAVSIEAHDDEIRSIGGQDAIAFSYRYETIDGITFNALAFAVWRDAVYGGYGLIFAVEAIPTTQNTQIAVYEHLKDTVAFFDARILRESDGSVWRYDFLNRAIPYPVLDNWRFNRRDVWTVYTSAEDRRTFAAVAELETTRERAAVLDALLDLYDDLEIVERRRYTGEFHIWDSATYRRNDDEGMDIIGRFYVTRINGRPYALHFETPDSPDVYIVIRDIFEPMVDGFAPLGDVIYADGNVQAAFIRAAIIIASNTCAAAGRNTICYGGGTVDLSLRENMSDITFAHGGDIAPIIAVDRFDVGFAGEAVDPFSAAVINVQANLPDEAPEQFIRLIAFGGASIANLSNTPDGKIERLTLRNMRDEGLFIRAAPNTGARVLGVIGTDETITAVALSPDGEWLRVKRPNEAGTGWIFRRSLDADMDDIRLPINNPDSPYIAPMAAIEILLTENISFDSLKGVLIQTPPGNYTAEIEINSALFSIDGGSMFFWRGDFGALQELSGLDGTFGQTLSRRRPAGWSADVLRGSVLIRIQDEQGTIIEAEAGTRVRLDTEGRVSVTDTTDETSELIGLTAGRVSDGVDFYVPPAEFADDIAALPTPTPTFDITTLSTNTPQPPTSTPTPEPTTTNVPPTPIIPTATPTTSSTPTPENTPIPRDADLVATITTRQPRDSQLNGVSIIIVGEVSNAGPDDTWVDAIQFSGTLTTCDGLIVNLNFVLDPLFLPMGQILTVHEEVFNADAFISGEFSLSASSSLNDPNPSNNQATGGFTFTQCVTSLP